MATINELLSDGESRMQGAVAALERELNRIRTGRANPSLVDSIPIDYYGVSTPLNQIASVNVPEARLLVIQPWDRNAIPAVEKAILQSGMGINPNSDGTLIRINLPVLTEERRKELVKLVRRRVEDGHVAVRNVRRDINERLRTQEKAKGMSQDEERGAQAQLQLLTNAFISIMDKREETKTTEVLEL